MGISTASYKGKLILGPSRIDPNLTPFDVRGHWEDNTFVPDSE